MTQEFSIQLCNELSKIFNESVAEGTTPHGFATSLVERYKTHSEQGSIFFGPIAVTLRKKDIWHSTWLIEDLRGGWGFSPLDLEMELVPNETPTLEIVQKELQAQARRLRRQADNFDVVANLLK